MKRIAILIFLCMAMATSIAKADTIVLTNGISMQVYNIETTQKWIFYTESPSEDADIKKLPIDQVFAYKIGEGPMTTAGVTSSAQPSESQASISPANPRKLDPVPADDNDALIAAYNNHPPLTYIGKDPQPDKYTNYFISLWGIEEGSVLSDENVEIGFEPTYRGDKEGSVAGYHIKVINKTDTPIYIDLASCFKIMNGGYSAPYFTNSVYTEGTSNTKGGALNMGAVAGALGVGGVLGTLAGGINIGGATTKSAGITTTEQRILSIPPRSLACLPGEKFSSGKEILECYEPIFFYHRTFSESRAIENARRGDLTSITVSLDQKAQKIGDDPQATRESMNIRRWMQTNYTSQESPKKIGRVITYSTSPDFLTYTSLPITLYLRGSFGLNILSPNIYWFNDETYDGITDKDHLIVGEGYVKSK